MKQVLFFLIISMVAFSCSPPKSFKSAENVTVSQARELIKSTNNLIILDVRTPEEWKEGVISGAMTIDFFGENFADKVGKLDSSRPVLVYCKAGGRSAKSTQILENAGFSKIYNLLGGYSTYIEK